MKFDMKFDINKLPRLILGLFCYALGIVLTIRADVGLAPWGVFHQGLSKLLPITFGQATMIVGTSIVMLNFIMKEKIGVGTILNMFLIGVFIDFISFFNIIPKSSSFIFSMIMLICGMFTIAFATCLYLGAGLGSGPRDGLMLVLTKRTNLSVGVIRGGIEVSVLIIGVILGGQVGIGTLVLVILIGPIVQFTFKILNFNIKEVEHKFITR